MENLTDHFIIPLYNLIFEQDPPFISQEEMETIVNIVDWYASLGSTFIRVYGGEKPLHVLPSYATDKFVIREASYHLSIGLLTTLHRKKKAHGHSSFADQIVRD